MVTQIVQIFQIDCGDSNKNNDNGIQKCSLLSWNILPWLIEDKLVRKFLIENIPWLLLKNFYSLPQKVKLVWFTDGDFLLAWVVPCP